MATKSDDGQLLSSTRSKQLRVKQRARSIQPDNHLRAISKSNRLLPQLEHLHSVRMRRVRMHKVKADEALSESGTRESLNETRLPARLPQLSTKLLRESSFKAPQLSLAAEYHARRMGC
jgi:hypothetical protein